MCGIAGIVELNGRTPERGVLVRMTDVIAHRGPDADGHFLDGPCALGHRRLAIIDLSGGAQPMSLPHDGLTVTFNGEIFNYLELKQELEQKHGRVFKSRSDTETLLHAYAVWGERCVERFNGQWAFAIWDHAKKRLFASRDRIGVRPFFWTVHDGRFLFASEVKSLFTVPGVPRAFDLDGLNEVLTYWCAIAPRTVWRGIRELPPGCSLVMGPNDRAPEVTRYFALDYEVELSANDDAEEKRLADELLEQLVAASHIRLRADVPVGAYVSGGLDSSVIAGIIKKKTTTPLSTFSVTFDEADLDESAFQREVVGALGTEHSTVHATTERIGAVFPDVVWHAETPVVRTAPAPMFLLAGLVRERGMKVVLTGEGADEMLGGYDIFKEAKLRRFWAKEPSSKLRPLLLKRLYPYMPNLQAQPEAYRRAFFHVGEDALSSPFFSHLPRWRLTQQLKGLLSDDAAAAIEKVDPTDALREQLPERFFRWQPFAQAQYLEATILLPGYILSSQGDRVAMGRSIEGRYPFLDVRVVEWAGRLDARQKMKVLDEKHLLKRAGQGLVPPGVLARKKQPYRAPDAASFFDAKTHQARHEWVEALLSERAVADAGLWRPQGVRKLVEKATKGTLQGVKDNMAFVTVLSSQILHQRFIRDGR